MFSAGPDIRPVVEALLGKAQDQQIWALKKLRLDVELCKRLVEEERCAVELTWGSRGGRMEGRGYGNGG